MTRVVWLLVILVCPSLAPADTSAVPPAYRVAAQAHDVPSALLYAVATVESKVMLDVGRRPWPWTLNIRGAAYRYSSRADACRALREALRSTSVVDVGIAQLNVRWQPQLFGSGRRFADPCDGLDPYANLEEAARLIRGHFDECGDWIIAAGRYHRPAGGSPAARYRREVFRVLTNLGAAALAGESAVPLRDTTFVPLNKNPLVWLAPPPPELMWITPTHAGWFSQVDPESVSN